jgi:hypothetical protein
MAGPSLQSVILPDLAFEAGDRSAACGRQSAMTTSNLLALSFCALLALFTVMVGISSLVKGRLRLVSADITRKDSFVLWIAGVVIQVLTGVVMAFYCMHVYTAMQGH